MRKAAAGIRRKEATAFYLMVAPWVAGFLVFQVFIYGTGLADSFTNAGAGTRTRFIGLSNYVRALTKDPFFWISLKSTLVYAFVNVVVSVSAGLGIAALLNRDLRGKALYRTIIYIPTVVPTVCGALTWAFMYDRSYGILNAALHSLGFAPVTWLADPTMLWSFIGMSVWSSVGASMIVILAGMQGVPKELLEAALIDGVGPFKRFLHVTFPLITPAIFFNLVTGLVNGMQAYTQAVLIEGAHLGTVTKTNNYLQKGNYVFMRHLIETAFTENRLGYSCALSWILFLVIILITFALFRGSDHWVYYDSLAEKGR
jgi:multiple sugar transport system permease protein